METKEIAKLTLHVEPEALQEVIRSGRLLEFAASVATQAAQQIATQLVDQVAKAALAPDSIKGGASVGVGYALEGGDFQTVPPRPRPHFGIVDLGGLSQSALQRLAISAARQQEAD